MPSRGSGYVSGSWSVRFVQSTYSRILYSNLPKAVYCTAVYCTAVYCTAAFFIVDGRNQSPVRRTYIHIAHTCGGCRLEARASFSHTAGWTHWNVKNEFEALRSKCTAWYSWGLRSVGLPAVTVVYYCVTVVYYRVTVVLLLYTCETKAVHVRITTIKPFKRSYSQLTFFNFLQVV